MTVQHTDPTTTEDRRAAIRARLAAQPFVDGIMGRIGNATRAIAELLHRRYIADGGSEDVTVDDYALDARELIDTGTPQQLVEMSRAVGDVKAAAFLPMIADAPDWVRSLIFEAGQIGLERLTAVAHLERTLSELEAAQARLDAVQKVITPLAPGWKPLTERYPECFPPDSPEEAARKEGWRQGVDLQTQMIRRALGLGEEGTKPVAADAAPLGVYGTSDDLIELIGAVDDELSAPYGNAAILNVRIVNGETVRLRIEYDEDGTGEWRIHVVNGHGRVLDFGHELVEIVPARGEDAGDDADGCPGYSDKAIVRGGVSVELEGADDA